MTNRSKVDPARGRVVAVIPARAGSQRLPLKALAPLGDAPLVWHVYRRVRACAAIDEVHVATDDARIAAAIEERGGRALLVNEQCTSGTERVARAVTGLAEDLVINVQGDQPFVEAAALERLVGALHGGAPIATLAAPLPAGRLADPAAVKVVRDATGHALYFSRAPIPGDLHLGLYGFTRAALAAVAFLPRGPLARAEDLEQLAWLEAGWRIAVVDAPRATLSVDTPADLAAARSLLATLPETP